MASRDKNANILSNLDALCDRLEIPKNILKQKYVIGMKWTSHKSKSANQGGVGRAGLRTKRWWRAACSRKARI